jgi:hypothetical protein
MDRDIKKIAIDAVQQRITNGTNYHVSADIEKYRNGHLVTVVFNKDSLESENYVYPNVA